VLSRKYVNPEIYKQRPLDFRQDGISSCSPSEWRGVGIVVFDEELVFVHVIFDAREEGAAPQRFLGDDPKLAFHLVEP
jgi:hypothetical protein